MDAKKSILEMLPSSTRGWMALLVIIISIINLTGAQWGLSQNNDPSLIYVWRDALLGALGIHAGSRVLEERMKK